MKTNTFTLARATITLLLLLAAAVTAWAEELTDVSYRSYNTTTETFNSNTAMTATVVTSETTSMGAANDIGE